MDDAGLHAANLAAFQLVLARAGGWPHEQGDGWVAADAASAVRFFSFTVLTRDGATPTPTVYRVRAPAGWVEMDLWGRPWDGDVRTPVLMRREPGPLPPPDPRVTVARTPAQLAEAERALAAGLEVPGLQGVLGEELLEHPVACAYTPAAIAVAFDDGTTVGVYLVGTATAARGKGLGTAVTAAAMAALPERPALLTATTTGRPVYERLGFNVVGRATMRRRDRD